MNNLSRVSTRGHTFNSQGNALPEIFFEACLDRNFINLTISSYYFHVIGFFSLCAMCVYSLIYMQCEYLKRVGKSKASIKVIIK